MKKLKIGDIAIEVMKKHGQDSIGYVWYGGLDEVFGRAKELGIIKEIGSRGGKLRPHPLNRHQVVLNALDRDKRFHKRFVRCTNGMAEVLVRDFELIK